MFSNVYPAFLGCTIALMFSDYQNKLLDTKFPFDVQIYSENVEDDFADELEVIGNMSEILDAFGRTAHIQHSGFRQGR